MYAQLLFDSVVFASADIRDCYVKLVQKVEQRVRTTPPVLISVTGAVGVVCELSATKRFKQQLLFLQLRDGRTCRNAHACTSVFAAPSAPTEENVYACWQTTSATKLSNSNTGTSGGSDIGLSRGAGGGDHVARSFLISAGFSFTVSAFSTPHTLLSSSHT